MNKKILPHVEQKIKSKTLAFVDFNVYEGLFTCMALLYSVE